MAAITTRATSGTGATVKNAPLTNAEVDNNFINLNTELVAKLNSAGGTVSGDLNITGTTTISTADINGGAIDGTVIGAATPAAITGTTITATSFVGSLTGSATTFTSTTQNSQFNSIGVGTAPPNTSGEIRAIDNITAYYSSDARLKENIRDIPNALNIVSNIGGKLFDWTDEYIESRGGLDGYFVQKSDYGVIAQDVKKVFPVAVRERQNGTLVVDYEKLAALAFAAINELMAIVKKLENK